MFASPDERRASGSFAINDLAEKLAERLHSRRQRRRMKRLLDLDDHMLEDVGVTRGEIKVALNMPLSVDAGVELRRLSLGRRCAMM